MSQIIKKVSLILGALAITAMLLPNTSEAGRRRRCCCQQSYSTCHTGCNQGCGQQVASCGCNTGHQIAQAGGCSTCNVGGNWSQQGNVQATYNAPQSSPPMAPSSPSNSQPNSSQSNPPAPPQQQ
jgi:hypothetical protein